MNDLMVRAEHPALATMPQGAMARGTSPEAWHVMKTVLFKGASDEMICTLLDYCKARKLDPLKKPFHIVKVYDAEARGYVESIWPSVSELRITAMRTGQYAGKADIEFGPDREKSFGAGQAAVKLTFPEWAQCRVWRLCGGERVEFAGSKVYWLETYAAKAGGVPNAMWQKRPRGQLAKCAEADALRSAFPEECGSEPTAEEMEGRSIGEYGPERARDVSPVTPQSFGVARFASLPAQTIEVDLPEHDPDTGEIPAQEPPPPAERPAESASAPTEPEAKPAAGKAQNGRAKEARDRFMAALKKCKDLGEAGELDHKLGASTELLGDYYLECAAAMQAKVDELKGPPADEDHHEAFAELEDAEWKNAEGRVEDDRQTDMLGN